MSYDLGPALLFCPADRPERFGKALDRADGVILDLEDAVAPAHKAEARETVRSSVLDPARTIVRINAYGTDEFADDAAMVRSSGYRWVMLPKAEDARALETLEGLRVIALVESALGVLRAEDFAEADCVEALFWGAEDLTASLGGTASRLPDGTYKPLVQQARSTVALAAAAHGKAMLDAVYMDIADLDGLRAEATDAAGLGFAGTVCIHPNQVPVVREAYAPTPEAVDHASRLLDAAATSHGAFSFEGRMVDEVNLKQARLVLARAGLRAADA